MKRILSILIISIIIISLSACGENTYSGSSDETQISNENSSTTVVSYNTTYSTTESVADDSSESNTMTTTGETLSSEDEAEIAAIKEEADQILDELMGEEE